MKSLIVIALSMLSATAIAETNVPLATATSSITLDTATANSCDPTVVENYTRHTVFRINSRPPFKYVLISQNFNVGAGCFEGFSPARVSLSAKTLDIQTGKVGAKPIWSFTTDGITGEIGQFPFSMIYRIDMLGCCASERTSKYFSLYTGELVASSTSPILSIRSDQEHDLRYISVESDIASSPMGNNVEGLATIFLGDTEAVRETLTVTTTTKVGSDWFVESVGWKNQKESVKNLQVNKFSDAAVQVSLRCRCDGESSVEPINIEIPITAEGFAEDRAQVSELSNVVLKKKTHNPTFQRTAYSRR